MISKSFQNDIYASLREEYGDKEVKEMMGSATYLETADSVIVTYSNGVQDVFVKTTVLIHENSISGSYTKGCDAT